MLKSKWNWRDAGFMYQQANDGGAGAGSNGEGGEGGGETPSLEQLLAELADLRKANKVKNAESIAWRKKLDEYEAAETKRKESELGEVEAAKKRAAELEAKLAETAARHRAERIANAVTVAALELDFINAKAAARLADLSGVTVNDETGEISGVTDALKALAKSDPYLIKPAGGGDINASNRGRATAPTVDEVVERKRTTDSMYIPF